MLMGVPWTVSREGNQGDGWKWHLMRRGQGEGKARRHRGIREVTRTQMMCSGGEGKDKSPAHTREHCLGSGVQLQ